MRRLLLCFVVSLLLCGGILHAAIDPFQFKDEDQRHLYQKMTEELRCPKCQNQNLADSESQIAADLRKELYQQLQAGKSEDEIINFMRERYGDFVLYKPRMQWNTIFLWMAPLGLILLVVILLWWSRRDQMPVAVEKVVSPAQPLFSNENKPLLPARGINALSLLVLVAVAVGSLVIYQHLGAVRALQITDMARNVLSRQLPEETLNQQRTVLIGELDDWLASHADADSFLYLRARLLSDAGLLERAEREYQQLSVQFPEQDNILSEYAQVLFLKNNRTVTDEARQLLERALVINPHNITALGMLGMSAFEQKKYREAIGFWQRLLQMIPAGTPQAEAIATGIARAQTAAGDQTVVAEDVRLRVHVSVAPEVAARDDETVFVLLRAKSGSRMPLAVAKTTVAALQNVVLLDTAISPMKGQVDLSTIETFEVVARLARSGQPIPAEGDWEGVSVPLERRSLPAQLDVIINHPWQP